MLTSLCGDYLVVLNIFYTFFFFNCFFISSWIAMFSYSGDFEVLLLVSFHCFCSFCHCLCYCKVMEMYLYVDLGLFFWQILIPSLLSNQVFPCKFKNSLQSESQDQSDQVAFLHTKQKEIVRIT